MYRSQDRAGGNNEEQTPGHSEFASSEGGLLNFLQENLIQLGRKPSDMGFFTLNTFSAGLVYPNTSNNNTKGTLNLLRGPYLSCP